LVSVLVFTHFKWALPFIFQISHVWLR
jgi:hypothetical protein